jgi:hypothetical protein
MRRVLLTMLGAAAVLALVAAPAAQALTEECHPETLTCETTIEVDGSAFTATLTGASSEAKVQAFESPSKARAVTWLSQFAMSGETSDGGTISATLDPTRLSTGTLLSLGNKQLPATATMRFFLRLETNGLTLVSTQPAVFQGNIHSIPPGRGDRITLISGPVKFHVEGDPSRVVMATLNNSTVVFGQRNKPSPNLLEKPELGMAGLGAILLVSGGLYCRRRTLTTE